MKYINRTYSIGKHHDIVVRRVAKKLGISKNEVIRRRIKSFDEMLIELEENIKHADSIDFKRM
jgi:hypothetical protein